MYTVDAGHSVGCRFPWDGTGPVVPSRCEPISCRVPHGSLYV